MNKSLLAYRYAHALLDTALKEGQDALMLRCLKTLQENWTRFPALREAIMNPVLTPDKKKQLLHVAAGKVMSPLLNRFFSLLLTHNREMFSGRIASAYIDLWYDTHQIIRGELYTASPLPAALSEELKRILQKALHNDRIELQKKCLPDLIGGFVLQIDSLRVDVSVRSELQYLKMNLLK